MAVTVYSQINNLCSGKHILQVASVDLVVTDLITKRKRVAQQDNAGYIIIHFVCVLPRSPKPPGVRIQDFIVKDPHIPQIWLRYPTLGRIIVIELVEHVNAGGLVALDPGLAPAVIVLPQLIGFMQVRQCKPGPSLKERYQK